jgi:membrane-bound lytic murein transglycosylase A
LQLRKLCLLFILLISIISCAKRIIKPNLPNSNCPPVAQTGEAKPQVSEIKPVEPAKIADYSLLKISTWEDIDGLQDDDLSAAWPAWQQSCSTLINKAQWQAACTAAKIEIKPSSAEVIAYLKNYFDVYSANNADGSNTGLITGYYEPLLKGSRKKSEQYPYPLYRQPKDLITVELGDVYPELKYKRVRGKLVGNKLVPYNTRAEIDVNPSPLEGNELLWVDDIIDVFFLQIQGSGLVKLDTGQEIQVGYADQNGHPYNSIGRILIERGELTADQASMQGIKTWARSHLDKLRDLLSSNPSYVFFKELPTGLPGPLGALGVPISAERSLAIDQKYLPLGAPVFLSTTQPNSTVSLKRLMVAQDTGGAIKGGIRADFFWGAGDVAGAKAGAMKQSGKIWVLLPKGFKLSQPN